MSGPQGSDPRQPWQPPGQGADHSSDPTVAAGYPWQQQPTQEATWQAPAYTPQYQQPADPAYPQQYPQPTRLCAARTVRCTAHPARRARSVRPIPAAGPIWPAGTVRPARPVRTARSVPGQYGPYGQSGQGSKRSVAVIGGVIAVMAVLFIGAVLILGFWAPGFFVTTKLDVIKAQAGVQQVLTDETTGYGAKNVKDVKCNNGSDPTVKKGATFECTVSIDGTSKRVTVTFQDNKGTYEVGRPQ